MKNYFRLSVFIVLSFIFICSTFSQNHPNIKQVNKNKFYNNPVVKTLDSLPYLGQTPPDTIPEKFGPGIISSSTGDEYSICFSQDGKEIYFSRYTQNVSNTIWWTHFVNSAWTTPVYAPFTGNYYNSEPFITTDNQKMYFVSERGAVNDFQLWFMTRSGSNWSTPQKLIEPFSLDRPKMGPSVAANGNLYFTQFNTSMRGYFYMAKNNNGVFETPVMLSAPLNAFYSHGHACIAPDESYIVFDAIPTQQSTGSRIYVSFRKVDSTWGNPVMLSNTINSTDNQYLPYISPDGKYLFYTKQGDMWWVDSKVVSRLKPIGINKENEIIPKNFELFQNYPNPFNPSTKIRFDISKNSFVTLRVYDILGKEIAILIKEKLNAGEYEIPFSINRYSNSRLTSGVYFYRIEADDFVSIKKMILLK
jgi:hypothetical protein